MNKVPRWCPDCSWYEMCLLATGHNSPSCHAFFNQMEALNMKTTVTPEIKISVVDLHTSCPVATKIKELEAANVDLGITNGSLIDRCDIMWDELCNTRRSYSVLNSKYEKLFSDYGKLMGEYNSLKIKHEATYKVLKIVRDSAESQTEVINEFF